MRLYTPLIAIILLSTLGMAQAIDTNSIGLIGYMNIGGPINLTKVNANMQNGAYGLFPTATTPNQQVNFTEGEIWFIGGDTGNGNNCFPLPYLNEDGIRSPEERSVTCTNRWGYVGDSYYTNLNQYVTSAQIPSCSGQCAVVRIRVRIRADGWIMAYVSRSSVPYRAALLRWRYGGVGMAPALVDDTVLGTSIERMLGWLNSTNSSNAATINFQYTQSNVSYYDFEFPSAAQILIGGRGTALNAYTAYTYGWGFSYGNRTLYHLSMSMRARNRITGYYINGKLFMCNTANNCDTDTTNGGQCSVLPLSGNSAPPASCPDNGGSSSSWAGVPFVAYSINTTTYNITANTFNNVTASANEMKAAVMMYIG